MSFFFTKRLVAISLDYAKILILVGACDPLQKYFIREFGFFEHTKFKGI